ncbi:MAG: iron-containing alcohol dehydrogenase [Spirochaetia bacterium]|nr:iron-containing alcohol dehydrogenase [Spirochaetia bacterium]
MVNQFSLLQVNKVDFGVGSFKKLASYIDSYKSRGDLLFLMSTKIANHPEVLSLIASLKEEDVQVHSALVSGEPTVASIDTITKTYYETRVSLVVGIGGGSVLDSAKAVSVMLFHQHKWKDQDLSIKTYLEGVGTKEAPSYRLPLILIPTTSGTGSEATKNGVVAQIGEGGFKKSFRHDSYVPDVAIIDPSFTLTLPLEVTASSGLDALTQLMEGYVSTTENFFIDSLALPAIHKGGLALTHLLDGHLDDISSRSDISYASYISGVTLAHKGLTYVHGLSGPMGAVHSIPHGIACAKLMGPINRAMVENELKEENIDSPYLVKMDAIAKGWGKKNALEAVEFIEQMVEKADFKPLREYGFTKEDLKKLSKMNSKRNSPVTLSETTIYDILISLL